MHNHSQEKVTSSATPVTLGRGELLPKSSTVQHSVSIIIPAYNEAESIVSVVHSLVERLPDFDVIVVDDGSTDGTAELAAGQRCRLCRHATNRGYGAAIRTGVMAAESHVVVCFDADGQHDPADLEHVIAALADADMVVGARRSNSHTSISRRPGKWVLSRFAEFLLGERIPDLNSGLRAFRRDILLKYMHLMPSGFSFSTTSTFAFHKAHRVIRWVPITTHKRQGQSSVSQIRDGFGTILLMVRLVTLFEPLKIFLPTSVILFLAGVLWAGYDIFFNQQGLADTTVLLLVAGLLVFFFGLICDQVSALRREIHE